MSEPLEGKERTAALRNVDACRQMADLCNELLALAPELSPREFLRTLGALVAGIDLGPRGFGQLARGGANGLIGAGFLPEYDDGTAGQARHFAGTAAAAALVGDKPAELLAHHVVDPAESIDGHLSTAALEFARLLIDKDLPLDRAGHWIESNICDPAFTTAEGFTPFDALIDEPASIAALQAKFSDTSWRALCELPQRIAVAAALSEPSGDLNDIRDIVAGIRELDAESDHPSELVRAVAAHRYDDGYNWQSDRETPTEQIERTLQSVADRLTQLRELRVPSADIDAYANLLLSVAHTSVRASRSGGVLGIGGQRISQPEAAFLDQLETILENNLSSCENCLD